MYLFSDGYSGVLQKCDGAELAADRFSGTFRVASLKASSAFNDPGHTDTFVDVERTDGAACGAQLFVRLKDARVNLGQGSRIRVERKRTVRHFENDVQLSFAVRYADTNRLKLAWINGQRDETWDGDIFPETTLKVGGRACDLARGVSGLKIEFAGELQCQGAHQNQSCCHSSAGPYILRVTVATLEPSGTPFVDSVIAEVGVLEPGLP
jgi:hypothetical protein